MYAFFNRGSGSEDKGSISEHRFGFGLPYSRVMMSIFISVVAAVSFVTGWISSREGDYQLGATMFGVSMSFYAFGIVTEKRNAGNRLLDTICLVSATFGLATTVFFIRYEAAKRAIGQ